ncbi:MAG: methyltransferase domain-containing protein [Alphaproteobacteria bacterium]|nr:methyltransferase domain-containing protein [Alphaproteobacteria bacterium]
MTVQTHLETAKAHMDAGRTTQAMASFWHCLELDPDCQLARFALASFGYLPRPEQMPDAVVIDLFDRFAETYDRFMTETLNYRGPALFAEAIGRSANTDKPGAVQTRFDILDLGCGTGLVGVAVRPYARRLDGIDLSPAMIAQARATGIYDTLIEGEILAVLDRRDTRYDLILAAELLNYFGALEPVFACVHAALAQRGCFIFSVDRKPEPDIFLTPAGRFAHSPDYVHRTAVSAGFAVEWSDERAALRFEAEAPNPALLALLRKRS